MHEGHVTWRIARDFRSRLPRQHPPLHYTCTLTWPSLPSFPRFARKLRRSRQHAIICANLLSSLYLTFNKIQTSLPSLSNKYPQLPTNPLTSPPPPPHTTHHNAHHPQILPPQRRTQHQAINPELQPQGDQALRLQIRQRQSRQAAIYQRNHIKGCIPRREPTDLPRITAGKPAIGRGGKVGGRNQRR